MSVVSDSSPLIYLTALSDFNLLPKLFSDVVIPPAVFEELMVPGEYPVDVPIRKAMGDWLRVVEPALVPNELFAAYRLHAGEREAILLARAIQADAVLIDDREAVRCARQLGLLVIPTATIYVRAKRLGLVDNVRDKLDRLRAAGFWLADADYGSVLRLAGED